VYVLPQTRTLYNLAKLLAHVISHFQLSLAVVKVIDFTNLTARKALFFRTMFGDLVNDEQADEVIRAVFSRAGAGPDKQLVRDGVLVFLHSYVTASAVRPCQWIGSNTVIPPARRYMESAVRKKAKKSGLSRQDRIAAQVRLRLARKALEAIQVDE